LWKSPHAKTLVSDMGILKPLNLQMPNAVSSEWEAL